MTLPHRLAPLVGADLLDEAASVSCQACSSDGLVGFYEANDIPTQTCVLLDDRDESVKYPVGDLLLGFCEHCGFIQNVRFAPRLVDYSKPTEESQAFSSRFQLFAEDLADLLVAEHDLIGKTVLEVGCGKGDFLALLATRCIARGFGIDSGFLPNRPETDDATLEFIRDWYGPGRVDLTGDLVLTRHLMEHIPNVLEFLRWLVTSAAVTKDSSIFTEVPDVQRVLEEGAFWDIYYEHCSYFTLGSLARALRAAGVAIHRLEYGFDGQYLLATGAPGADEGPHPEEEDLSEVAEKVVQFAGRARSRVDFWQKRIGTELSRERSVALWGGGSKVVAFLATVQPGPVAVVDVNPHKQGKWLPSVGVEVEPPESLVATRPDLVIPMNAIYADEIRADLHRMGLNPEIEPL